MFQPNQLEYFYTEEETSTRAWALDRMLNRIYTVLKFIVGSCVSIALYRHLKQ